MNIKLYTASTELSSRHSLPQSAGRLKPASDKETGDFDKVTINRTPFPESDKSFAQILAHETAMKLKGGVSQERVNNLHQQVLSGTYKPDARQTAERILGYR